MHKIYFDDRSIVICKPGEPFEKSEGTMVLDSGSKEDVLDAAARFKSKESGISFVVQSEDPEVAYRLVCGSFKEVNAAGGLVMDMDGKYLVIRRNSVWDLPKGHQEEDEDIMVTAVREVEEETGVSGIVPEKLLCVTDHCYYRDGICHLKHTWWYLMSCTSGSNLVPQTEEGITETEFVGKDRLEDIMKCTYPSIADVFDAALRNDETFI